MKVRRRGTALYIIIMDITTISHDTTMRYSRDVYKSHGVTDNIQTDFTTNSYNQSHQFYIQMKWI